MRSPHRGAVTSCDQQRIGECPSGRTRGPRCDTNILSVDRFARPNRHRGEHNRGQQLSEGGLNWKITSAATQGVGHGKPDTDLAAAIGNSFERSPAESEPTPVMAVDAVAVDGWGK